MGKTLPAPGEMRPATRFHFQTAEPSAATPEYQEGVAGSISEEEYPAELACHRRRFVGL